MIITSRRAVMLLHQRMVLHTSCSIVVIMIVVVVGSMASSVRILVSRRMTLSRIGPIQPWWWYYLSIMRSLIGGWFIAAAFVVRIWISPHAWHFPKLGGRFTKTKKKYRKE